MCTFLFEYEKTNDLLTFCENQRSQEAWFLSYGPKISRPIRMKDFLNCSISQTIKLNFYWWLEVQYSNKFTQSFQMSVVNMLWQAQNYIKYWVSFFSRMSWYLKLFFYLWMGIDRIYNLPNHFKWVWSGLPNVIENNARYFKLIYPANELRYENEFLYVIIRHLQNQWIYSIISIGCGQACLAMPKVMLDNESALAGE